MVIISRRLALRAASRGIAALYRVFVRCGGEDFQPRTRFSNQTACFPSSCRVLLTPDRGYNASLPAIVAVLAEVDALPGAEAETAFVDGDHQ